QLPHLVRRLPGTARCGAMIFCSLQASAQTPGGFTNDQASSGATLYQDNCSACHGPTLQGSPAAPMLSGAQFVASWGSRSAGDLFRLIQSSMPPGADTPLSADDTGSIVAHIPRSNGAQPGSQAVAATPA